MVPSVVAKITYPLLWGRGFKSCGEVIYTTKLLAHIPNPLLPPSLRDVEVGYLVRSCESSHKQVNLYNLCLIKNGSCLMSSWSDHWTSNWSQDPKPHYVKVRSQVYMSEDAKPILAHLYGDFEKEDLSSGTFLEKHRSNLRVAAMLMIISIQLTRRDTIRKRIASHW